MRQHRLAKRVDRPKEIERLRNMVVDDWIHTFHSAGGEVWFATEWTQNLAPKPWRKLRGALNVEYWYYTAGFYLSLKAFYLISNVADPIAR